MNLFPLNHIISHNEGREGSDVQQGTLGAFEQGTLQVCSGL